MSERVAVGSVGDFADGARKSVEIAGREVTVVRLGDRFTAVWNRCPHSNGRLMDGVIADGVVTCPLHRWKFDLFTGRTLRDRFLAATVWPVVVEAGTVFVVFDPPGPSVPPGN